MQLQVLFFYFPDFILLFDAEQNEKSSSRKKNKKQIICPFIKETKEFAPFLAKDHKTFPSSLQFGLYIVQVPRSKMHYERDFRLFS